MELVVDAGAALEARIARLAFMPPDADAAIARMKAQVGGVWVALGPAAVPLVPQALRASASHAPGLWNCRQDDLDGILCVLDQVLAHHHPEEIRVASFALLCGIADAVRDELGTDALLTLLRTLEALPA
jgi:hypothetical protein